MLHTRVVIGAGQRAARARLAEERWEGKAETLDAVLRGPAEARSPGE